LHQVVDRCIRVVDEVGDRVAKLPEIMRRNVGCHANGDASRPIEQQVRQPPGEDGWLGHGGVVVRNKIDRVFVDVQQEFGGDLSETRLGVAHGRCAVAIDRSEIPLPVDQGVAQIERLRHAHQRVIDRAVAVRVIVLHHLADRSGALAIA
jgi:hypothetical protein